MPDKDEDFLKKSFVPGYLNYAISIDGISLDTALRNPLACDLLVAILFTAKVVAFNQLFPHHKEKVVKLLKKKLVFKPVILAIGLGMNNTSML